jgi:hypothetical protein
MGLLKPNSQKLSNILNKLLASICRKASILLALYLIC